MAMLTEGTGVHGPWYAIGAISLICVLLIVTIIIMLKWFSQVLTDYRQKDVEIMKLKAALALATQYMEADIDERRTGIADRIGANGTSSGAAEQASRTGASPQTEGAGTSGGISQSNPA